MNVLAGEPKAPEHLALHPFGKVPVVEVDGFRVIETPAIAAYLDAVLPGRTLIPTEPKSLARATMTVSIVDSYGYGALVGGVVAYHLFPDFVGGKNDEMHHKGLADGQAGHRRDHEDQGLGSLHRRARRSASPTSISRRSSPMSC